MHSKFIETHRGVLSELLDRVLPPAVIDASASGVGRFARRYGFRDNRIRRNLRLEQERIGFHWVESALSALP